MKKKIKATKAYKDFAFLTSHEAREIRVLSEFIQPEKVFRENNITDTFVFFGSARIKSEQDSKKTLSDLKKIKNESKSHQTKINEAEKALELSRYYEDARELAKKLTIWSNSQKTINRNFIVASGGGPGIMEAANRGAKEAKGKSIGMNISLPFEQYVNDWVDTNLAFEFHYFFIRKFWLVYMAKALIVFPGGFGTLDELFEVLTLIQTEKIKREIKIIVYGSDFWKNVLNFETLIQAGTIKKTDMKLFDFCDNVDDAFQKVTSFLESKYSKK
jgi:uncharacterized protein (TIGR00730 family)